MKVYVHSFQYSGTKVTPGHKSENGFLVNNMLQTELWYKLQTHILSDELDGNFLGSIYNFNKDSLRLRWLEEFLKYWKN